MINYQNSDLFHYYLVYKNGTSVTRVSANNFRAVDSSVLRASLLSIDGQRKFSFPADAGMYYGYSDRVEAMKNAKTGALIHIGKLIAQGESGLNELKQYRIDHYDDLNINLIDNNIKTIERQTSSKNSE